MLEVTLSQFIKVELEMLIRHFSQKVMRSSLFMRTLITSAILSIFLASQVAAQKGERYEVDLSMYSLRQLSQSKGGDLDPLDYPEFAKDTFGITQIDVRDGGFPKKRRGDLYYCELKRRADAVAQISSY